MATEPDALLQLERRLRSIGDRAMRRGIVLEALGSKDPEAGYALLTGALGRSASDRPDYPTLRQALHELLVEGGVNRLLSYDVRSELYALARAAADEFIRRLLRTPGTAEELKDPTSTLSDSLAEISLGARRSIARGDDHPVLERLLLDADPTVIQHLLVNPRVTEDDVLRITSRRPIAGSTLGLVYASRRFGSRSRVLLSLARNPYCPTDVAIAALARLPMEKLRQIERDATLHQTVRQHAADERVRRSVT